MANNLGVAFSLLFSIINNRIFQRDGHNENGRFHKAQMSSTSFLIKVPRQSDFFLTDASKSMTCLVSPRYDAMYHIIHICYTWVDIHTL